MVKLLSTLEERIPIGAIVGTIHWYQLWRTRRTLLNVLCTSSTSAFSVE